jgi:hypothetical protein
MESAVSVVRFVRKHLVWAVLFPLLGLFGGFLNNFVQGKVYEADLMIRTRILKSEEFTFLVSNYQRSNYPGLSKQERRRVRGMKFKATKEDPFVFGKLTAQTTDTLLFKRLQATVAAYIENQPSVHASAKNINDANSALINEYTSTIRKAEALLEDRDVDPTQVYKNYRNNPDLTLLYDRRRELEIARRDSTAIVIVSDFAPQEYRFKKTLSLGIGLFVGLFAAAVMLFVIYFAEYYHKTSDTAS